MNTAFIKLADVSTKSLAQIVPEYSSAELAGIDTAKQGVSPVIYGVAVLCVLGLIIAAIRIRKRRSKRYSTR